MNDVLFFFYFTLGGLVTLWLGKNHEPPRHKDTKKSSSGQTGSAEQVIWMMSCSFSILLLVSWCLATQSLCLGVLVVSYSIGIDYSKRSNFIFLRL